MWWYGWRVDGKLQRRSLGRVDSATAKSVASLADLSRDRAVARDQAHRIIDEIFASASSVTIEDAWNEYCHLVAAAGRKTSADMMRRRRTSWAQFVDYVVRQSKVRNLASVTREHAVGFVATLNRNGSKGKTRKNVISCIASVWNMLAVQINAPKIFDGLLPDTSDSEVRLAFTPDEERRVLAAAREMLDGRWWLASLIARHTGLRYVDIRHLEWSEFDDEWVLRLTPNKTKAHGIKVTMPIVEPLLSALKEAKAAATSPYVLPDHAALRRAGWRDGFFSEVLEAAGVDTSTHTFHSWRHTFRTRLSETGVSDDLAKRLGGWTDDRTAMGYDHAERIREAREAIEAAATTTSPASRP